MIDTVTVDMVAMAYVVVIGALGLILLWHNWKAMQRSEEEYKTYVRKIVDEYMKERE